jgi:hypothetical protein
MRIQLQVHCPADIGFHADSTKAAVDCSICLNACTTERGVVSKVRPPGAGGDVDWVVFLRRTGIGIVNDQMDRLSFGQGLRRPASTATGLGLAITRRFC